MADQEKKEVRQVVSGKIKQKGLGEKAAEAFFSEDTRTVGDYILWDLFIPGVKDAIYEVIGRVLFGSNGSRKSSRGNGGTHVSYSSYYDSDRNGRSRDRVGHSSRRSDYDFSDIVLDTRGDAEEVLSSMEELVRKYGEASVQDLCNLVGIDSQFTDTKYGWTDCRDFSYRRSGRGYILDFAKPIYLD